MGAVLGAGLGVFDADHQALIGHVDQPPRLQAMDGVDDLVEHFVDGEIQRTCVDDRQPDRCPAA